MKFFRKPCTTLSSILLLVLCAFASPASAAPVIGSKEFTQWMRAGSSDPHALVSSSARIHASDLQYVFVGGFLNEGIPAYFKDNIRFLEEIGVPSGSITKILPSSGRDVSGGADELYQKLRQKFRDLRSGKLVIIAHSKGAVEAMTFAFRHPEFFERHVSTMFLIQGAFGGSPIADYLLGEGVNVDHRMPLWERMHFRLSGRTERLLDPLISRGLVALSREEARSALQKARDEVGPFLPAISDRVYYVTSFEHPRKMGEVIDCMGWYLKTYYGKSDGMVLLEDQVLEGVGTPLVVLQADHADLATAAPISNAPRKLRHAMMAAMVLGLEKVKDSETRE